MSGSASAVRWPAEWERHDATWIAWPHHEPDWPGKFGPIPWVYAEIVRALHRYERVEILCQPLMPALGVLRDAPFVDDVSVFGQALHIRVKDLPPEPASPDGFASFAASARRAMVMDLLRKRLIAGGIEVLSIHSVYPSLEDIFVELVHGRKEPA